MSIDTMIAAAERTLGLTGRPNYITQDYAARDGAEFLSAAWCDEGVTYWARQSGEFTAACFGADYAYTVAHAQRFADAGQWHAGAGGIARGDVVFFSWSGGTTIDTIEHVGIVTGTSGSYVYTVEANTGDQVARRVRTAGVIVGYGRPAYSGAQPSPAAPAWPGRTFKLTSPMIHGDDVRTWQQRMHDRGWNIVADGWYGSASASICTQFQREKGLTADSEVGPITWAAAWTTPIT
ncbi:peptidoglycan-binding protein [Kitasatospora mediocidica]|uniref:peptidoglycan-binding protein n=1 Tax=Kitasatospora mediocidica TaxID=58352 RepID=UPI00068AAA1E|nr:peptidoglycan-binding protein [Kitasatospora mediocidica]